MIDGHRMAFSSSAVLSNDMVKIVCIFEPTFLCLGAMYDDHLRFIGRRIVDFLLVLIELFPLDVTAEVLRVSIGSKSAISF